MGLAPVADVVATTMPLAIQTLATMCTPVCEIFGKIKDSQLDKLEALVNATTEQNEALDIDLRTVLQKVAARDQEIERLNQLLDGGQDYQKLSFEHVNKSNQQLVTNLNENVQFLTSQIVNLENEVLHRQGLQEEVETQNKELASAAKDGDFLRLPDSGLLGAQE